MSHEQPNQIADIALTAGDYAANINPCGAGLRALTYQGRSLTETYPVGAKPPMKTGCVLAPWPNRTADGVFDFRGTLYQLPVNEPARNNAIHGLVFAKDFTVVEHTTDAVSLTTTVDEPWPWPTTITMRYQLAAETGLTITATATNTGNTAAPYGIGLHTYLNAQGAAVDDCALTMPVQARIPMDPTRCLPCGPAIPVGEDRLGSFDDRLLRGVWMDYPFHPLTPNEAGEYVYTLHHEGRGVQLICDHNYRWVQVFTADPDHGQAFPDRGRAVAVEPMTCPPNALRTGEDLIVLEPGATTTAVCRMVAYERG
ncbi:aldose 1-epimerase family protein [Corynebacterium choanae]|uniref:Aldose 1-epimerase n=1 Tax=Corynebacterium choanae TaxID=1862358 RepID=A0A3G6J5J7_9CORY|nr:aldose 1-epimerase family protein [Corynebacterium choanae]AZA13033.1 Aldose 1-epimerase [Corynebacterium choanae]